MVFVAGEDVGQVVSRHLAVGLPHLVPLLSPQHGVHACQLHILGLDHLLSQGDVLHCQLHTLALHLLYCFHQSQ